MTTDHVKIRQWIESRGGHPACVRGTGNSRDVGLLRIDFPGYSGQESLEEISWSKFFDKFEEENLALLYQDRTSSGAPSHFNKLVTRSEGGKTRGKGPARYARS